MKKIIAVLILLQALDCVTTVVGLHLGFAEGNRLLPALGWGWLTVAKVSYVIGASLLLFYGYRIRPKYFVSLGAFMCIISAMPVANNVVLLLER